MVSKFLPAKDAAERLGYRNRFSLYHAIRTGVLRIGYEVQDRRPPDSKRPFYFVDVAAAEKRLMLPPEKRSGRRKF